MRITGALLLVCLSASLSGCWSFRKKAPKPLPPLNPPVIVLPAPNAPVDLPPEATTPIQIEPPAHYPEVTVIKPELQPKPEKQRVKAPPKPAARKAVSVPAPAAPVPAETEVPVPTPPALSQTPQLGELISDARRLELGSEIEQSLNRARAALSLASQRALTRRQNETANRVRTFVRQAEDAKLRDISTAAQLARRADLLAQDLAATFK